MLRIESQLGRRRGCLNLMLTIQMTQLKLECLRDSIRPADGRAERERNFHLSI